MVQDIARGLTTSNLVAYGLPSVIAQVIVPKLVTFCQRYPRGAKILTYLAAFLSVCGTFSFGIKPIFEKFVWSWLPRVQLQSDDLLYQHLRKFIEAKSYPTTPHVLRGSAKNNGTASGGELDDGRDCSDAHKAKKNNPHARDSKITYKNLSSRVFFHNGILFALEAPVGTDTSPLPFQSNVTENLAIRAFAFSHKPLKSLLDDAWEIYGKMARETSTAVYKAQRCYPRSWILSKHKPIRHLKTVDIDHVQKKKLIDDIAKYVSPDTKAWYQKRGVPRRRGYLFHGPPGTGKSSLAAAVAGHFRTGLYTLTLHGLEDDSLLELVNQIPTGNVLLIEDVDSAGIRRESYDDYYGRRSGVTLSGLLNALDGASAPEGHILIMSTNTPEALDPALKRAGRVDCEVEFKHASKACAANIFLRMMEDDSDVDGQGNAQLQKRASSFATEIPEEVLSPAEIQGYLLDYRFDVQGAITNAAAWAEEVVAKRAKDKEAAEEAEKVREERANRRKKERELEDRREELEAKALERKEAAAAALEEMERKTKEITLKADKLRAEAEIARYEALNGKSALEQNDALMTPADSDDEHS